MPVIYNVCVSSFLLVVMGRQTTLHNICFLLGKKSSSCSKKHLLTNEVRANYILQNVYR